MSETVQNQQEARNHTEIQRVRCGSPLRKKPGRFCQRWPLVGRERCGLHGGLTPRGPESANYKHGLRSDYMPSALAIKYTQALSDPTLLNLDKDVALIESRLMQLLAELESPGAGWPSIIKGASQIEAARGSGDVNALKEALDGLLSAIKSGESEQNRWIEIGALIEARRRIIDTIGKQQIRAQEALTLDRASVLFSALARAVTRNVSDKVALERVLTDFQSIVGRESLPVKALLAGDTETVTP